MNAAIDPNRVSQLWQLLGPAVLLRWPLGSKGYPRKWKHLRITDMTDAYLAKFDGDCNIGVALGEVSNGLVSIDLDEDRYVDCLLEANPLFATTLRTRASRGCNIWLRCSGSYPSSCKLKDASGREVGEWRADVCQTIVSGMHPDGLPYRFVVEKPVITISYKQIIWPPGCLVPPDATESKRVRGVKGIGEQEVVAIASFVVTPSNECLEIQPYLGNGLIADIAPRDFHQNNDSLFNTERFKICQPLIERL